MLLRLGENQSSDKHVDVFSGYMQDAGSTPATSTNNLEPDDVITALDKIKNITSTLSTPGKYSGAIKK